MPIFRFFLINEEFIFWDIALHNRMKVNHWFGGTYHLHFQGTLPSCPIVSLSFSERDSGSKFSGLQISCKPV
jgi:hypothetical protein